MPGPITIVGIPSIYPNAREITFNGATGENKILIPDNLASALQILEGANSYMDIVTTNGAELIKFGKNVTINANYALEGYPTGRNVLRVARLLINGGDGTDFDITEESGFNTPTVNNATNLANNGSSGSFSLSSDGKALTFNITETIIEVISESLTTADVLSSNTSPHYIQANIDSGNINLSARSVGSNITVDWQTIINTGDVMRFRMAYITST